jgi:hypothetical protein
VVAVVPPEVAVVAREPEAEAAATADVANQAHSSEENCVNSDFAHREHLIAATCALIAAFAGLSFIASAQQGGERTFATPGDAVFALYNAVKSGDSQALNGILGSNAGPLIHTGDAVADKKMTEDFIRRYDQMHRVVVEPDQSATLYIGAENWPAPIPIVKNASGAWYFDTDTGKKEVLYRRVGTNENDAIEILHGLVDAQQEYASEPRDGSATKHFALRFLSAEGKHDGLFWKTSDTEAPSPIGPLIAGAASEGYSGKQGDVKPFHGYYYRILTKQGAAAKGGAKDYLANGQLTRGFAFVAYPAEYRNSGVMTFIVNQDGVVYQKDLGQETGKLGAEMTEYNPDKSWTSAD